MNLGLLQDRIAFFDPEFLDIDKEIDSRFLQMRERNFFSSDLVPGNESIVAIAIALLPFVIALAVKLFQWIATLIAKVYAKWKAKKDSRKYGDNCDAARMARYIKRAEFKFKFSQEIAAEFQEIESKLAKQVRSFQEKVDTVPVGEAVKAISDIFTTIISYSEASKKLLERGDATADKSKEEIEEIDKVYDRVYNSLSKLKELSVKKVPVPIEKSTLTNIQDAVSIVSKVVDENFGQTTATLKTASENIKNWLSDMSINDQLDRSASDTLAILNNLDTELNRAYEIIRDASKTSAFEQLSAEGSESQVKSIDVSKFTIQQFVDFTEGLHSNVDMTKLSNLNDKIGKMISILEQVTKDAKSVSEKIKAAGNTGGNAGNITNIRENLKKVNAVLQRISRSLTTTSKQIGVICKALNKVESSTTMIDRSIGEIFQMAISVISQYDHLLNRLSHVFDNMKKNMNSFKI